MKSLMKMAYFLMGLCFWVSVTHAQSAPQVIPGEYLVKLKSAGVDRIHSKLRGKAFLKAAITNKGTYHVTNAEPALISDLKKDPDVEYVEPNFVLQSIESPMEGGKVTALEAKSYDQTSSRVSANAAWNRSLPYDPENRPIVAIVDTGLDANHYVFRNSGALWQNLGEIPGNGKDDDGNGYIDDMFGWNFISNGNNFYDDEDHGTHVAGIVLGATQDILATTLEPAKIRIMPLKFLDSNGSGSTTAAISAINYAVNNGAKVINCSWGGGAYSRALHEAMTNAYKHGVLVVTAAGNYGSDNDVSPIYPANYDVPSNISVAASNDSDRLTSFSNYGGARVNVAAPGSYVYSTLPGGWFASLSGTSMAAPFVAGAAALAAREAQQISGYQLRSAILGTGDFVADLQGKISSGARINEDALVLAAQGMNSAVAYQPVYSPQYSADRSPASEDSSAPAGGGCGLVSAVAMQGLGSGAGGGNFPGAPGAIAFMFLAPLLAWFALRTRAPVQRRRYERYLMQSNISIRAGERELVGTLKTISLGGLSFNVDEALERGGSITLKIAGPDGRDAVEVEGRIVWSERNEAYGVQFESARDSALSVIQAWTRNLVRQDT